VSSTVTAISLASPCVVTLAAGHGVTTSDKLKFSSTGTWLDEHIVTAHTVNVNDITLYTESDSSAIDSTDFTAYVSGGAVEEVLKTVSGISHLEGKTVTALIDGSVSPNKTVASGAITLDRYANKIHVGLPYTSVLEPMNLNVKGRTEDSKTKKQKINRAVVAFYETVGGKIGPDVDDLKTIPFGTGDPPLLFTGEKVVDFEGDFNDNSSIVIVQDQPLPMTVLAISPRLTVNDD